MHPLKKITCALAVLAISLPALAESIDVQVIGTITPAACTPSMNGGGVIDYGTINPTTLSDTDYTVLPVKTVGFSISCDAPAKVALSGFSGRPGTTAGVSVEYGYGQAPAPDGVILFGASKDYAPVLGLGLDGTDKIGGYSMIMQNVLLDGKAMKTISRAMSSTEWSGNGSGQVFSAHYSRYLSFGVDAATGPVAFEQMSGDLSVQAYLNKASELDLSKPVRLDGLTTLELVYL